MSSVQEVKTSGDSLIGSNELKSFSCLKLFRAPSSELRTSQALNILGPVKTWQRRCRFESGENVREGHLNVGGFSRKATGLSSCLNTFRLSSERIMEFSRPALRRSVPPLKSSVREQVGDKRSGCLLSV